MIELHIDSIELRNAAAGLGKLGKEAPAALASAINRTLSYTATQTNKLTRQEYRVKAKDIRSTLRQKKASKSKTEASITSTGKTLSLYRFKTAAKKSVRVKIKKSEGVKVIKTDPKPFVQTMNNATGIFKRVGKKRLPVVMLKTASIPQMIGNQEEVMDIVSARAGNKLAERLEHEIKFRLDRAAKGGRT